MQIYSDDLAVKYVNGYFVVYKKITPKESGKTPIWRVSGTYATPSAAIKNNTEYSVLVPLWEESKRLAAFPQPVPKGLHN